MSEKKRILIIDDHAMFREGLRAIIGRDPRFEITGEAGDSRTGLRLVEELRPDLVLVDISLPDMSGHHLTREIRSRFPDTLVLIISMHSGIDHITAAFKAGATGYVVKESASDQLLQGLTTVADGDYYMDSSVSHQVAMRLIESPAKEADVSDPAYETLTPREQEIMRLLADGLSPKEIGAKLYISAKTVENHRASILNKLGLHSTMELIRYAAKFGLIDLDRWTD